MVKKGNEAKVYLKDLYKDTKQISFDFMGVDKYGRVLGVVWFDGININEELKVKGYCMPYEYKP